jgi:hypothetical protein
MVRRRRWEPPAPGITPRFISGWPNVAVGEARIMSHLFCGESLGISEGNKDGRVGELALERARILRRAMNHVLFPMNVYRAG